MIQKQIILSNISFRGPVRMKLNISTTCTIRENSVTSILVDFCIFVSQKSTNITLFIGIVL